MSANAPVSAVESGSPAEKAGIAVGDIVVEVDGTVIKSTNQMISVLREKQAGDHAEHLAAAGLGTLRPVAVPQIAATGPCAADIRIADPEGCPAFYGRTIRGLRNGPSPDWLQRRLVAAGRQVAATGTELVPLTAPRGVPYIATRAEAQIGGAIALEMLAEPEMKRPVRNPNSASGRGGSLP